MTFTPLMFWLVWLGTLMVGATLGMFIGGAMRAAKSADEWDAAMATAQDFHKLGQVHPARAAANADPDDDWDAPQRAP
jgi:hypothetical protein